MDSNHDAQAGTAPGTLDLDDAADDRRRARVARALGGGARLFRVAGRSGATLTHALAVRAGDLGSVAGHWFLELAVPTRASAAELWWRGYPFQLARRLEDAPWLSLPGVGGAVFLVDDAVRLEVIDAFASATGGALEVLVAPARARKA